MNNQFSANLRNLRTEHKLSQKDLAQILGIDHQTISRLERDYNEPNLEILEKLADYFKCSVDYLLGREREDGMIVIDNSSNSLSDVENHLVTIFRALNRRLQIKLLGYADGLYTGQQEGA